jgi:N-glycosylase/DNA lyase
MEKTGAVIEDFISGYEAKREAIQNRLAEFAAIRESASDAKLFEELVFCIFTAGCSARMGLNSIEKIRTSLPKGSHLQIENKLVGSHRYPRARAGYIIHTRKYLQQECSMKLREKLESFGDDWIARRDFFAANKGIKGIGYKEASHFLRNIGYCGYAILDKHILRTLYEINLIDSPLPPSTKKKYLAVEELMLNFADRIKIDFDELDLLLWSNKTGEILK